MHVQPETAPAPSSTGYIAKHSTFNTMDECKMTGVVILTEAAYLKTNINIRS